MYDGDPNRGKCFSGLLVKETYYDVVVDALSFWSSVLLLDVACFKKQARLAFPAK